MNIFISGIKMIINQRGTLNTERGTRNVEHGTRNAERGTRNAEQINQSTNQQKNYYLCHHFTFTG